MTYNYHYVNFGVDRADRAGCDVVGCGCGAGPTGRIDDATKSVQPTDAGGGGAGVMKYHSSHTYSPPAKGLSNV